MGLQNRTKLAIQEGVDAQIPFNRGNMKGFQVNEGDSLPDLGRLPEPYRTQIKQQHELHMVHYIILSYGTPIGWILYSGTKVVPDVSYSVTTAHHQNVVKVAMENYDFYSRK
jgi:hypothetical protein